MAHNFRVVQRLKRQWNWINAVAILAALGAVGRTVLLAIPEPIPWFSELGELVYDACLAYLVGFIFHLLVVELPRRRDAEMISAAIASSLRTVAGGADSVLSGIKRSRQQLDKNETFKTVDVSAVAKAFDQLAVPPRLVIPDGRLSSTKTWPQYFMWERDRSLRAHQAILPFVTQLDAGLVQRLILVEKSAWFTLVNLTHGNDEFQYNTDTMAQLLTEYHELCNEVAEALAILRIP